MLLSYIVEGHQYMLWIGYLAIGTIAVHVVERTVLDHRQLGIFIPNLEFAVSYCVLLLL